MIYFDNAATGGFKPECVIAAVEETLRKLSVNAGRSSHKGGIKALKLITAAREAAAEFFGVKYLENVIFTKNCTEALNMAILGTVKPGGEIIITLNEHNSVIRPCYELERAGKVRVRRAPPDENGAVNADIIKEYITDKTYLVCVNHVSNVTGGTSDIEGIAKLCGERGILMLCDAAQSAGHIDINMAAWGINMLAAAPHKGLLSPQGLGVLCFNDVKINPITFGGTGTESHSVYQPEEPPEALESGTLNLPAIAGFAAALKYINENKQALAKNLKANFDYLYGMLCGNPMVNVYSRKNNCGIVSFLVNGYNSETVGDILNDKYDIAVRAGLCCAPLINEHLGTLKSGVVRASLSPFNTAGEIKTFLSAIDDITYN
jgi:cysteine desulfurase/selenocysteine lyase